MKKAVAAAVAALLVLGLGACGEKPQVTQYKAGKYQGKPDTLPWDNERFKGDKAAWENAIKTRQLGQNEYVRIAGDTAGR
ncbi:hypothetical protein [Pelomicrobium methylotrophicum]|uniref:Lipoprotein n=1 Tax=Pelomicrobium methylotrophicum TaxID=2602750 RepID=A0A5C7EZF3_9PROT|nr:hypothetical protein [Pelomicrobium methylotrophicum]TXF12468.1 hypothetical protein FR698_06365 [Pelomicrobium methylotrophicum]